MRVAYFVVSYNIPKALVMNADQTGIQFVQMKGKTWDTGATKTNKGGVQGGNDKRQITGMVSSCADGVVGPGQIVWAGKTGACTGIKNCFLRAVGLQSYTYTENAPISDNVRKFIPSMTATETHWSNLETTIDYIDTAVVPFLRQRKVELGLPDNQVCLLLLDCWWGWTDKRTRDHVKQKYPMDPNDPSQGSWLKFAYIDANLTSEGQPADKGEVAWVKGNMRGNFQADIAEQTCHQLAVHQMDGSKVKLDFGAKALKPKIVRYFANALASCPEERIRHFWESCTLDKAWDGCVQAAALRLHAQKKLFTGDGKADIVCDDDLAIIGVEPEPNPPAAVDGSADMEAVTLAHLADNADTEAHDAQIAHNIISGLTERGLMRDTSILDAEEMGGEMREEDWEDVPIPEESESAPAEDSVGEEDTEDDDEDEEDDGCTDEDEGDSEQLTTDEMESASEVEGEMDA